MQYILCESKIRQRVSPVSGRLKLYFYKLEEKLELFFRLNLSIQHF